MKKVIVSGLTCLCASAMLWLCGCTTIAEITTTAGQAAGVLTPQQAASINKSAKAIDKTFEDITPEQEYYIGRSVAATVLTTFKPNNNEAANRYLNQLGQMLAQASDKPETFGGYHFQLLDAEDINAFAAPGGLIMISRGMIRCCRSEDELAAVLAHEIGHVQNNHGLRAIKTGRLTSALTILATESMKTIGGEQLAELTKTFENTIGDITSTMMNNGYARNLERDADKAAVTLMKRVGYNPMGLVNLLTLMKQNLKPGGHDFSKTHPDPEDRIRDVKQYMGATTDTAEAPASRQRRFTKAMDGV